MIKTASSTGRGKSYPVLLVVSGEQSNTAWNGVKTDPIYGTVGLYHRRFMHLGMRGLGGSFSD